MPRKPALSLALVLVGLLPSSVSPQGTPPQPLPTPAPAPRPSVTGTFGFGSSATPDEIAAINIDVRPDGAGLPSGSGTPVEGAAIFQQKCSGCHGANGEGTSAAPKLIDATPFQTGVTTPTVGNYWPYATTVWDYINRAMPFDQPGSLSANEVYALTAYLLAQNQVIGQDDAMTAESLPKVRMPNVGGFDSPDPRPDVP
jgi:cytochrome c